jgi:hypothetical protein
LWGLAHFDATYQVYQAGLAVSARMEEGRLFQEAFYVFAFATTSIVLAIKLNADAAMDLHTRLTPSR